jgi:hypothetical protein
MSSVLPLAYPNAFPVAASRATAAGSKRIPVWKEGKEAQRPAPNVPWLALCAVHRTVRFALCALRLVLHASRSTLCALRRIRLRVPATLPPAQGTQPISGTSRRGSSLLLLRCPYTEVSCWRSSRLPLHCPYVGASCWRSLYSGSIVPMSEHAVGDHPDCGPWRGLIAAVLPAPLLGRLFLLRPSRPDGKGTRRPPPTPVKVFKRGPGGNFFQKVSPWPPEAFFKITPAS